MRSIWQPLFLAALIAAYHEPWCHSVAERRMVSIARTSAEELGMIPAADCHPDGRIRYLGTVMPAADNDKPVHVREYTRADGTVVHEHDRAAPHRQ